MAVVPIVTAAEVKDLKDSYAAAVTTLTSVRDTNSTTVAQCNTAIKKLATVQLGMLKVLKRLV
jgi:hypothetical protein